MSTRLWPALEIRFDSDGEGGTPAIEDRLAAALDDFGPFAIQQFDDRWLVFFRAAGPRDLAAAAVPAAAGGRVAVRAIDVADQDWAERSQRDLTAVEIGRVTIAPPWAVPSGGGPREAGRVTVVIQPSMGFGTGHHQTTRLCAALLQRLDLTGRRVLDIGTGSGVLALVAHALGAASVLAVDDDPDALASARENLALNGVRGGIDLLLGDFRMLPIPPVDLVVANLTGDLVVRSAGALAGAVAAGGALVVSGVTLEEESGLVAAFAPWLGVAERLTEDEWLAALLRPTGLSTNGARP